MMGIRSIYSALDTSMHEVFSKALSGFLLRVLGAAAQFAFTVLLARFYGAEGMGAFTLGLSVTVVASAISRWGVDQSALKYIAVHAEVGEWGRIRRAFSGAFVLVLSFSIIITLLLLPMSRWIAETLFSQPQMADLLHLLILSIIPFSLLNLAAECIRALKRVAANTIIQVVLIPLLAMTGLLAMQNIEIEVIGAAYAYVLACFIVCVISLICWKSFVKDDGEAQASAVDTIRQLLRTANPMAWVTIVGIAMSFSETVLLGVFRNVEEVGVYAAALRVALLVNFVLVAFNTILAPKFAALFHQNRIMEMQQLAAYSVMVMLALTAPMFAVFLIFPEYVLQLFGPEFVGGSVALTILALGQLINVATGPVGIMLLMTGHEQQMRRNRIIFAVVGLLSGILLVPEFGITGAAISAFIGGLVMQCLSVWAVKKYLKINLFALHFLKGIKSTS